VIPFTNATPGNVAGHDDCKRWGNVLKMKPFGQQNWEEMMAN